MLGEGLGVNCVLATDHAVIPLESVVAAALRPDVACMGVLVYEAGTRTAVLTALRLNPAAVSDISTFGSPPMFVATSDECIVPAPVGPPYGFAFLGMENLPVSRYVDMSTPETKRLYQMPSGASVCVVGSPSGIVVACINSSSVVTVSTAATSYAIVAPEQDGARILTSRTHTFFKVLPPFLWKRMDEAELAVGVRERRGTAGGHAGDGRTGTEGTDGSDQAHETDDASSTGTVTGRTYSRAASVAPDEGNAIMKEVEELPVSLLLRAYTKFRERDGNAWQYINNIVGFSANDATQEHRLVTAVNGCILGAALSVWAQASASKLSAMTYLHAAHFGKSFLEHYDSSVFRASCNLIRVIITLMLCEQPSTSAVSVKHLGA